MDGGSKTFGSDGLPVLAVRLPDHEQLNMRLRRLLIDKSQTEPNQVSNQRHGQSYFDNRWLSRADLHKSDEPDMQRLVKFAERVANRALRSDPGPAVSVVSMWCIVSKPGLEGRRHNHGGCVSGSYYVYAGSSGAEDGGLLQFYVDRRSAQPSHSIKPESGVLYLFPSPLRHSVSRYDGTDPRIVIGLNTR
jgi:hypothetical protein